MWLTGCSSTTMCIFFLRSDYMVILKASTGCLMAALPGVSSSIKQGCSSDVTGGGFTLLPSQQTCSPSSLYWDKKINLSIRVRHCKSLLFSLGGWKKSAHMIECCFQIMSSHWTSFNNWPNKRGTAEKKKNNDIPILGTCKRSQDLFFKGCLRLAVNERCQQLDACIRHQIEKEKKKNFAHKHSKVVSKSRLVNKMAYQANAIDLLLRNRLCCGLSQHDPFLTNEPLTALKPLQFKRPLNVTHAHKEQIKLVFICLKLGTKITLNVGSASAL